MFVGEKGKNNNGRGYVIDKNYKMFTNGIYGMAIGDAVGVPYKFSTRDYLDKKPCTDMVGYGAYFIPRGYWSYGTSMALATLDALINDYDLTAIMDNYVQWFDEGKYACNNQVFDYDNTAAMAIYNYKKNKNCYSCGDTSEYTSGNESLMRILPICLYAFYRYKNNHETNSEVLKYVFDVSSLTYNTTLYMLACGIYYFIIKNILDHYGTLEERVDAGIKEGFGYFSNKKEFKDKLIKYDRLKEIENFKKTKRKDIKSSEYVVDTLEAAIWCLIKTDSYKDCILKAVNLGNDTDAIACVAGGLAGLAYTISGIPIDWKLIIDYDYLDNVCEKADERYEVK